MPLHHYLPATFIASFSNDSSSYPRRNRTISVGDKQTGKIFRASAGNVAAINNLYTLVAKQSDQEMIEVLWSKYEAYLDKAIDKLIEGTIDAKMWIRILVPFVACMLVRGPDFNQRFEKRIQSLGIDPNGEYVSDDNVNFGRLLELQRLLGPVTVAKWVVIAISGASRLITNDLGYAPFANPFTREYGIAIPLDLTHILAVIPRTQGNVIVEKSGKWIPIIEYVEEKPDNQEGLNKALSSLAQRFIFGPDDDIVKKFLRRSQLDAGSHEPEHLGFISDPLARAHEFTWHRLAAALEHQPDDDYSWDFSLDWEHLAKGWHPMVVLPTNLLEFPPALRREDDIICIEFYDSEVYYLLSKIRDLEQFGQFDLLLEEATRGLALAKDDEQKKQFFIARAAACDETERYDSALQDYNSALSIDPKSVIALTNQAVIYLKRGNLDKAYKILKMALSIDPDFGVARLNVGSIHYMRNEPEAAVEEFTRALKSLPTGPSQGAAYLSRGNAYLMLGDTKSAIDDFNTAFINYPDSRAKAQCKFRKAIAHLESDDHDSAISAVQSSIDLDASSPEPYILKAQLLVQQTKLNEAISELSNAINLDTSAVILRQALDYRVRVYIMQGLLDEALLDCYRIIEIDGNNSASHHNLGMILMEAGKFDEAIAAFDQALELDNKNSGTLNNRGIVYAALGKYSLATKDFLVSAKSFGSSSEAGSPLRHLAYCYAIMGKITDAKKMADRAVTVDSNSLFNDQVGAIISLYLGDFEQAFERLSAIINRYGGIPDIAVYLCFPIAASGRVDKAKELSTEFSSQSISPIANIQFRSHAKALCDTHFKNKGLRDFYLFLEKPE